MKAIKTTLFPVVLLLLSSAMAAAQPLTFINVTVIDVEEGVAKPDMSVIVTGDRITAVGTTDEIKIPNGATIIDGKGKYLIPGLWDMHAHISSDRTTREILFPLFIAHGVTGIRSMATDCFETGEPNCEEEPVSTIAEVREWRREIGEGTLVGPKILAGSYYVNSPGPGQSSTPQYPGTAEHGREHARLLHERGIDFIKIYDMLSRDAYFAMVDEAKQLGLPFAGHVPIEVRASEASDAGQRSIEHVGAGNVLKECSSREDDMRRRVIDEMGSEEPEMLPLKLEMVESYDPEKCAALFTRFVENGTWLTPTLMVSRLPNEIEAGWREDPRSRFIPAEEWVLFEELEKFYETMHDTGAASEPYVRWVRQIVEVMQKTGVRLLAGSDAGFPGIFWGSGLHEELELLVSAGLTEVQALQTATINPALFLGKVNELATIETGKLADLVLLDGNPLEDISNTQKIRGVVANGRYFDRAALDQMLAEAEKAANP